MPIESRKDKRSFNQGKTQQISKVETKKKYWATNMTFGIHDKPLMLSDDWDWLFIKKKVGFALWPMLREF
jgi:hypothetical protein